MRSIFTLLIMMQSFLIMAQSGATMGDWKVNAPLSKRESIQQFYKDRLKLLLVTPESPVPRDYIQFDNDLRINIIYQTKMENHLTAEQGVVAPWIKIEVDQLQQRAEAIRDSGVIIIKDAPVKGEIYFQAPDGLVYRMVSKP